jgi:hypothetical protein
MVKRIVPVGFVSLILMASGALCQNPDRVPPDAPTVQRALEVQKSNLFVQQTRPSLGFAPTADYANAVRRKEFAEVSEKDPDATIRKLLYPHSPVNRHSGSQTDGNASFLGRATLAASGVIVTRDDTGKVRLNTAYVLRTLTSVAADTASRPYWRRSSTDPASDFGSTVGNDAGMNVWHEVGPSIEQMMKGHTPRFVLKIAARVSR